MITSPDNGEALGNAMIEKFEATKKALMDKEDLKNGYLEVRGRQGQVHQVDFVSLTMALVVDTGGVFDHWAKVSDVAAELKHYGKTQKGSIVVTERRGNESENVIPTGESS